MRKSENNKARQEVDCKRLREERERGYDTCAFGGRKERQREKDV